MWECLRLAALGLRQQASREVRVGGALAVGLRLGRGVRCHSWTFLL